MPDPSTYRPATGTIPLEPGVYRFRDPAGRVIYVGKAKSLRQRLNSYFADLSALHPRTRQMVTSAAGVEWTTVTTEVEALQLEYNWIKEFDPRFNVRYRDDKSYPSLAVTLYEQYPRLQVMRGPKKKGVRYFGPYAHAWAIRETLDLLVRVFPARTCSAGVFTRAGQVGRPCLLGYIGKCSAPCVGRVSADEHRQIVDDFCDFMAGQTDTLIRRMEREMVAASEDLDFERAARVRDDVGALRRAMEKQAVVFGDGTDADVVAFAQDDLEASVQVFHVRGGRVRGQRGWAVDKVEDLGTAHLVGQFVSQFYADQSDEQIDDQIGTEQTSTEQPSAVAAVNNVIPREILVPELPEDVDALAEWLSVRRGSRVVIRVPQRGDKKALMETVARNAAQAFTQHKLKRASDLTARSLALSELQEVLGLAEAPLRIECFDISHNQNTDVVASMVVFEDGLARRSEYRRFAMRETGGDTDWIAEAVRRRFARYLQAQDPIPVGDAVAIGATGAAGNTGRDEHVSRRFAYPPNVVVVDGAGPQADAAQRVLDELGITDVAVVGLAKRLEEVWPPGEAYPLILPRTSEALYLLQRVRDEAHRFAITYHRQKRSKSMLESALDGVPGLGATRRKAVLTHFGSLTRLRKADLDEVLAVPGIGQQTAMAIFYAVHAEDRAPEPALNTATGELVPAGGRTAGTHPPRDTEPTGRTPDDLDDNHDDPAMTAQR